MLLLGQILHLLHTRGRILRIVIGAEEYGCQLFKLPFALDRSDQNISAHLGPAGFDVQIDHNHAIPVWSRNERRDLEIVAIYHPGPHLPPSKVEEIDGIFALPDYEHVAVLFPSGRVLENALPDTRQLLSVAQSPLLLRVRSSNPLCADQKGSAHAVWTCPVDPICNYASEAKHEYERSCHERGHDGLSVRWCELRKFRVLESIQS
jgi:hypothetical protein